MKRTFIVCYINSRWNEQTRSFPDMESALEFVGVLDKRIERGTCHGYIMSDI